MGPSDGFSWLVILYYAHTDVDTVAAIEPVYKTCLVSLGHMLATGTFVLMFMLTAYCGSAARLICLASFRYWWVPGPLCDWSMLSCSFPYCSRAQADILR